MALSLENFRMHYLRALRGRRVQRQLDAHAVQRQRGQALVLAIVVLLVLCVGVIVVFNTGQAVSKKVELVNTADAAAYSAAIEQARAYNLIAYMNRAAVANEVAVAQATSIYSYVNFYLSGTKELKDRLADIRDGLILIGIIPGLEEAWAVAADMQQAVNALGKAQQAIQKGRDAMQKPFSIGVQLLSRINQAYSDASLVIADASAADAALLARKVVSENTDGLAKVGARGDVILGTQVAAAASYAKRYKLAKSAPASEADRYANVVMEARDGFSRERNGDTLLGAIRKKGGTDIVTSRGSGRRYNTWVAADTLDFYIKIPFWLGGGKVELPLAWAGAAAIRRGAPGFQQVVLPGFDNGRGWTSPYLVDQHSFDDHDGPHYDRYSGAVDNHKAGNNVRNDPAVGGTGKAWLSGYQGLQDYNDVAADKATVPYDNGKSAAANGVKAIDVGPIFTVLVEQPMNTVHTSDNVSGIGGPPDFQAPDKTIANDMTALSSAQVYFSRPRGFGLFDSVTDTRREMGSLFSPYWQARLVDTPCKLRQEVAVAYGAAAPCI